MKGKNAMKRFTFAILFAGLFIFSVAAIPQDKKMAQQKRMEMMEIMKDSAMVKMMMDHIITDSNLRMAMMRKLASFAKSDSLTMISMRKMLQSQSESQASASAENEIIVKFKPHATSAQIEAMESDLGLRQVKEIPALNTRVYRITSTKSLKEVIEHCGKHAFVEYAEPNYRYKAYE